jgi:HNH endonuclease
VLSERRLERGIEMITQARLKELLYYDPKLGWFMWRVTRGSRAPSGGVVGTFNYKGYLIVEIEGRNHGLHRLAWLYVKGVLPEQVDHISGDKADNRFANLRPCNTQQNCAGRGLRQDNASGFKGVSLRKFGWRARIRVNYIGLNIGHYTTTEDAARAYDEAARKHFGVFARTNALL